ncbi:MAG: hypothetical protein WCI81_04775 [Chlorobiaceae bacterium]
MSDALLSSVLSAVIAGVFTLVAKRMESSHAHDEASVVASQTPTATATTPSTKPVSGVINYGSAIKHIGILQFLLNIVGFLVGIIVGATGAGTETLILMALFIGTIVLIAGFFWSALSVAKSMIWKYLVVVALGVAITTLIINSIILQIPLSLASLAVALVQNFSCMGIGGFIARAVKQ